MVGDANATAGEGSVVESKKSLKWTLGQNKQGSNPAASELTLEWGNRRGEVRRAESADLPAPSHQQGGMKSAVSSHSGVWDFLHSVQPDCLSRHLKKCMLRPVYGWDTNT